MLAKWPETARRSASSRIPPSRLPWRRGANLEDGIRVRVYVSRESEGRPEARDLEARARSESEVLVDAAARAKPLKRSTKAEGSDAPKKRRAKPEIGDQAAASGA
jgi:hypothetical protein